MTLRIAKGARVLGVCMVLAACSPALNWRETRLSGLTALLPCKPDQAQRDVQLGTRTVRMEMQGCDKQSTLFAISHIALRTPAQASEVIADWRSSTLANMRSTAAVGKPFPVKGLATHPVAVQIDTQGMDASGAPVQAKLAWFVSGTDVFHLAVYSPKLVEAMTEPLFSDLRISP